MHGRFTKSEGGGATMSAPSAAAATEFVARGRGDAAAGWSALLGTALTHAQYSSRGCDPRSTGDCSLAFLAVEDDGSSSSCLTWT